MAYWLFVGAVSFGKLSSDVLCATQTVQPNKPNKFIISANLCTRSNKSATDGIWQRMGFHVHGHFTVWWGECTLACVQCICACTGGLVMMLACVNCDCGTMQKGLCLATAAWCQMLSRDWTDVIWSTLQLTLAVHREIRNVKRKVF